MDISPQVVHSVQEDLEYLSGPWAVGDVTPQEIRRGSALLRRLLGEDKLLEKTWNKFFPQQPYHVPSTTLASQLPQPSCSGLLLLASDSVEFQGCRIAGGGGLYSCGHGHRGRHPDTVLWVSQKLSNFVAGRCLQYRNTPISRRDLIDFVANSLGGVHAGPPKARPKARRSDEALKRVPIYWASGAEVAAGLDQGGLPMCVVEVVPVTGGPPLKLDFLMLGILAIGQRLATAPDTKRLFEALG